MIFAFAIVQVAVAAVVAVLCVVLGLLGRKPSDLTLGATVLIELLLIAQLVVAIVAPAVGNPSRGSALEFYVYLVTALLIPVLGVVWALLERTRWSTVVLGIAAFAIAVMVYRMYQIWALQVA
ncbi:hypothetical protein [Mesorhizobium japonicum]|uniref:hypothetical protein n=1 Tax=Mesorhizobium japonicum TaxID=2066070 RepID=UPI003B5CEA64